MFLGLAAVLGISPVRSAETAPAEHKHAPGEPCTENHDSKTEHKHAPGEPCTEDHDSKAEHKHAPGEPCTEDHDSKTEHKHAPGEPCTEDHGEEGGHSDALADMIPLHVDEKARHSLDMRFEQVTAVPNEADKTLHGQMVIPPHAVTTYALPSAGRVTFYVKSAQAVRKGELLYTLASPDIVDMEGNAAQAKAALDRAAAELATLKQRQAQLEQIGTKNSELNTSISFKEAEADSLKAALKASESKLHIATNGGRMKDNVLYVRSAQDGSVQSVDMTQGAWGEQGAPALVMTGKGELEFAASIYGAAPVQYAKAQLALTRGKQTELLDGTLRVAEQVDPATQTRALYFTPDRLPEGTHAGQLARLDLYSRDAAADGFISVPNTAVVKVGVNDVVFIKTGEDGFIMKKVQTLPARQGKTPVKGLIAGQTIVTKGGYELKYILPTAGAGAPKAAGHFHADGQFHEGEH